MTVLAVMYYFIDRGYFYNRISINDFDYYIGLLAVLTWTIYLILLVARKAFGFKIFNVLLCLQLFYFFFRIFLETDKFVFPLTGSIIVFIMIVRIFFLKP